MKLVIRMVKIAAKIHIDDCLKGVWTILEVKPFHHESGNDIKIKINAL